MKYILGQAFLDRYEVEKAHKQLSLGIFHGCSDDDWNEFASSTIRKVVAIAVYLPVGLIGATVGIAWAIAMAPFRLIAKVAKNYGEVFLLATNPFVLYKNEEKEASE